MNLIPMFKSILNKKCVVVLLLSSLTMVTVSHAQVKPTKDTGNPSTVTIVSAFKPQLKPFSKINFSSSSLLQDTSKTNWVYRLPQQNLNFGFQPAPFNPAQIEQDTLYQTGYRRLIRAGYGNFSTPYLQAAASFGDPTALLWNIHGNYRSSKGKIEHQNYALMQIGTDLHHQLARHELSTSLNYRSRQFYLYGYDHSLFQYSKSDVNQHFSDLDFSVSMHNTDSNAAGINYRPQIAINLFSKKDSANEQNLMVILPFQKTINESFAAKLSLDADLTFYKTKNQSNRDTSFKNHIIAIRPSVQYSRELMKGDFGISGIMNEGKWNILPSLKIELPISGSQLLFQAGWVGQVIKNNYRNLSEINPFLTTLNAQKNTTETELYGGVKIAIGKRFVATARAGWLSYNHFQLFISDTSATPKTASGFVLSDEERMSNFRIKGELSYQIPAKLSCTASVVVNGFTGVDQNEKAWNTLPLEFSSSIRWNAFKNLFILTANLRGFAGGKYLSSDKTTGTIPSALDASLGVEKTFRKQFSVFLNVNNIFGKPYERWNGYPVYGLNMLGGLSYRF